MSITLHVTCHMLPSTVVFISIIFAAASTMGLRSSQLGPHAKAALAYPFNFPLAVDRARGAAQNGEFRVRDFAGFCVFTAEISSTFDYAESCACAAAQLSAFLCTPPPTSSR